MSIDSVINKYFNFLVTDFNFEKPVIYTYIREQHTDYIKENIVVKIIYDGGYWCNLIRIKNPDQDFLSDKKRVVDFSFTELKYYDLSKLDEGKKLYDSVSEEHFPKKEKELWYYSTLLKQNPEVLHGDFLKFSLTYRLLKKFGLSLF